MKYLIILLAVVVSYSPTIEIEDDNLYTCTFQEITVVAEHPDKELIAKVIYSEGSIGMEDYLAIGEVIMNRVTRKNKSIKEVIFAKHQFNGVGSRKWNKKPTTNAELEQWNYALYCADLAYYGSNTIPDYILYFHNRSIATNIKHINSVKLWKKIGQHEFCYKIKSCISS